MKVFLRRCSPRQRGRRKSGTLSRLNGRRTLRSSAHARIKLRVLLVEAKAVIDQLEKDLEEAMALLKVQAGQTKAMAEQPSRQAHAPPLALNQR